MSNVFSIKGGKEDKVKASEALRAFADLMEEMEISYGDIEVAGVALVPEIGLAYCGNSQTGNDGMLTMFEIGKTGLVLQYMNGEEEETDGTIH
jgi:hypothetical protein